MNQIKKCFIITLSLLMIMTLVLTANAATVIVSGDWSFVRINNNREIEIESYNGSDAYVTIYKYYSMLPITSIGANAFQTNRTLTEITMSENVKCINSSAFLGATALESVNFSEYVIEVIDSSAFSNCTSLTSINLEDTVITEVSNSTFMNCDSLSEVNLPETVTSIGENAFAYCDGLTKITIPESVTEIHEKAFYNTPNVVIYCYEDSTAHLFAEGNSIEYVLLDPPVTYILGDVDNSGEVSILDATEVQLLIAQLVEPQDEYTQLRADIDSDGVLSIMDATSIQMYIAGYEVEEPIGETFEV